MVPMLRLRDLERAHTPSLLPQPSEVQAYSDLSSQLWAALQERGAVVLELGEDSFAPFQAALEASTSFFASDDLKHVARSATPGEGYVPLSGKELLCTRLGSNSWGSGRLRQHHQTLATASAELDRLGRTILSAVCRSPELDVHPGGLLGLLDDAPLLRGRASASVLRCSQYPSGALADALAFAPHHDRGVVTLVTSLQVEGLQVQLPAAAGGQWVDVPLGPGRVAALAGYSLSYALGGLLQPVLHRVRPCGGPVGRTSLAYELCLRPTAQVDPAAVTEEAATQPGPAGRTYGPMHVSELMQLFDVTHPQSINGVGGATPAAMAAAAAGAAAALGLPAAMLLPGYGTGVGPGPAAGAGVTDAAAAAPAADGESGQAQVRSRAPQLAQTQPHHIAGAAPFAAGAGMAAAAAGAAPLRRSSRRKGSECATGEEEDQEPVAKAARLEGAGAAEGGAAGAATAGAAAGAATVTAAANAAAQATAGAAVGAVAAEGAAGAAVEGHRAATGAHANWRRVASGALGGGARHELPPAAPAAGWQPYQQAQPQLPLASRPIARIKVKVGNSLGYVSVRVRPDVPLLKTFNSYCDIKGVSHNGMRFVFDGKRVCGQSTPAELGMEDGDVIDAVIEQAGS